MLIFAFIRFAFPTLLYLLWFGPVWDWIPNKAPPMYFETWFYGVQRLSGTFSWPNHMAFYFVAFGPLILLSILNKKLHPLWWILYLVLLIWSLSRSGLIAFGVEILILWIFLYKNYKHLRKIILYTSIILASLWVILGGYLYFSWKYHQVILRGASTAWHAKRALATINEIKKRPIIGHWLWTAWPAAHYIKSDIIPESWFLQIFYELGIVGVLRFIFIILIIYQLKVSKLTYPYLKKDQILQIGLIIWLIGLLVQGLVLHSFEDSMVSIPLFILVGISLFQE